MKITRLTNDNITIQARNETDFAAAMQAVEKMIENNAGHYDIGGSCDSELWIDVFCVWNNYNAAEIKADFNQAKKDCK